MSLYGPVAGSAVAEIMSKAWELGKNSTASVILVINLPVKRNYTILAKYVTI